MPLLTNPRAGIPASPDSPANVPDAPPTPPGPEQPLEPGFPLDPDEERETGGDDADGSAVAPRRRRPRPR